MPVCVIAIVVVVLLLSLLLSLLLLSLSLWLWQCAWTRGAGNGPSGTDTLGTNSNWYLQGEFSNKALAGNTGYVDKGFTIAGYYIIILELPSWLRDHLPYPSSLIVNKPIVPLSDTPSITISTQLLYRCGTYGASGTKIGCIQLA